MADWVLESHTDQMHIVHPNATTSQGTFLVLDMFSFVYISA